jgi:hypothetical protein
MDYFLAKWLENKYQLGPDHKSLEEASLERT